LAAVNQPVVPLADPDSAALTARLKQIPGRLAVLRQQGYDPAKQDGFLAGWSFDKAVDGGLPPLPGSSPAAVPVPMGDCKPVEGMNDRQAVAVGPEALQGSLDFAKDLKNAPFTISCWLKTKSGPFMGGVLGVDGLLRVGLTQAKLTVNVGRVLNDNWPSAMLSSWTNFTFTYDGKLVCAYRNGVLMSAVPVPEGTRLWPGKKFSLGGMAYNDDPKVIAQDIYFYNAAFTPEAVNDLYLWGKYSSGAKAP